MLCYEYSLVWKSLKQRGYLSYPMVKIEEGCKSSFDIELTNPGVLVCIEVFPILLHNLIHLNYIWHEIWNVETLWIESLRVQNLLKSIWVEDCRLPHNCNHEWSYCSCTFWLPSLALPHSCETVANISLTIIDYLFHPRDFVQHNIGYSFKYISGIVQGVYR